MPSNLTLDLRSPTTTEMELISPISAGVPSIEEEPRNERNKMKKELGLLEGVAIILGIIFGSGNTEQLFCERKKCFWYKLFYRDFCVAKGCNSGSERCWHFHSDLDSVRRSVYDWCSLLRRARNHQHKIRRRLRVHQWRLWAVAVFSLSVGCKPDFRVRQWKLVQKYQLLNNVYFSFFFLTVQVRMQSWD